MQYYLGIFRRAQWLALLVAANGIGCGGSEAKPAFSTGSGTDLGNTRTIKPDASVPGAGHPDAARLPDDPNRDDPAGAPDGGDGDGDGSEVSDVRPVEVVDADDELSQALCDGKASGDPLQTPTVLRGTWDKHVGLAYQDFAGVSGYPCAGFDLQQLPALDDPNWVPADDPTRIGFSQASTFCDDDAGVPHGIGEFTYFRSNIWVPPAAPETHTDGEIGGFVLTSLVVEVTGVDDAVKLWIYNSEHPTGYSPEDNSACSGNGDFAYDFAADAVAGETNTIVMVHMDSECALSTLENASIVANGASLEPVVTCQ